MLIGSALQPVVTILDGDLNVVATFGENGGSEQVMFAHQFEKAGSYYIRVEDYQRSGRAGNFYRIIVGEFPLILGTYPLGMRSGSMTEFAARGYHTLAKFKVEGKPSPDSEDTLTLRPENAFNTVRVALGVEPEMQSQGGAIAVPITVNGRIDKPGVENRYRFRASKGEQLVFEVNARRLGSSLDSYLEILDAKGQPIERAIARPVWSTSLTLRDHDSAGRGMRLLAWDGIKVGDYVMVGGEIIRAEALPLSPDNDTVFEAFGGQRLAFFDTTPRRTPSTRPFIRCRSFLQARSFLRTACRVAPSLLIVTTTAVLAMEKIRCCTSPRPPMENTWCAFAMFKVSAASSTLTV